MRGEDVLGRRIRLPASVPFLLAGSSPKSKMRNKPPRDK